MSTDEAKIVSVVLVGCGCPLRSMGWYHAEQLLTGRCPSAMLKYVVEPWYMTEASKGAPGHDEFHEWKGKQERANGIQFFTNVTDVPAVAEGEEEIRLAIISARTADNPRLFADCLKIQCPFIFLEKPGAPTVEELEHMRDDAAEAKTEVFMGFNKNVSSYVQRARDFVVSAAADDSGDSKTVYDVTFLHNNNYKEEELPECFERNSEGLLKNMLIHELALLSTFYGVTVDNIATIQVDLAYSSSKTLKGPSSDENFTDFDKLKFEITTKAGVSIQVAGDRCGGDDSVAIVTEGKEKEVARFTMPDEETVANIPNLEKDFPGAMPYFFTQDPDYCSIKERVAKYCAGAAEEATGVATIDIAVTSLKLAEHLTPILRGQILAAEVDAPGLV